MKFNSAHICEDKTHVSRRKSHHHHHHHVKPLWIHLLDEGLSTVLPSQSFLVIDFIPPSLRGSTSWSTTIHGSPVCYLECPSIVFKASYATGPSPFSGFKDVYDVTKLGFAPYPLVCPMILPGHTNHCPLHITLSSCKAPLQGFGYLMSSLGCIGHCWQHKLNIQLLLQPVRCIAC